MRKFNTVSVVGLGYIGLPTAAVIASRGVSVIGVDVNAAAVTAINEGHAHFFEPELDALVAGAVRSGHLRAVTTPEPAEAFIIAVPTPVSEDMEPDLSYVEAAARSIAPVLRAGDLVILESTSPVGTIEHVSALMAEARPDLRFPHRHGPGPLGSTPLRDAADVLMAYCPERILPGRMITELVENDRIIGGLSQAATDAAAALYGVFVRGELLRADGRTAEMVKLVENASRDVSIAFANELSKVCDKFGLDVWRVIELANRHPRVNILNPGPGVGGHCIAVDPWFIVHAADGLAPLMRTAREVNDSKPAYVAEQVAGLVRPGERIACLGLAYKADTDDLRESPAIEVVEHLAAKGLGPLLAVEPNVAALPERLSALGVEKADLETALAQADLLLLLVDHREFRDLDRAALSGRRLHDTRGVWRDVPAAAARSAPRAVA